MIMISHCHTLLKRLWEQVLISFISFSVSSIDCWIFDNRLFLALIVGSARISPMCRRFSQFSRQYNPRERLARSWYFAVHSFGGLCFSALRSSFLNLEVLIISRLVFSVIITL
jgi:hypothetical protein